MIDEIHARNIALIREAVLVPAKGLTVLTGETGAGKTALLSACKLLCGERSDASMVREGTESLQVEGRFFDAESEMVVSRKVGSDGRSRVSIDGAMASVGELQTKIGPLVDLCGQHEHQRLMKPATHVHMLDAWASSSIAPALEEYQSALDRADQAAEALQHIQELAQSSSAKLDEARFTVQRIDAVDPQHGEYEELVDSLSISEHAESLAHATEAAHQALSGDSGAIDAISEAAVALDGLAKIDGKLGDYASTLREASYVLEDVARGTRSYCDAIEFDPETLAANQERIAALQGLMRSYGPGMNEVLAKRAEAAELIAMVDDSAERERRAKELLDQAETDLQEAAVALDDVRAAKGPLFAEAVNRQMERLEMAGASLTCGFSPLVRGAWTKMGPSQVEFQFSPAEGMQARPLARIASGGEMSRVMLAIKAVLGEADEVETLIFDEVDAGVGGATAVALGQVLADLAKTHQVIVVTHLAQIAVRGETHYQVSKNEHSEDGLPETVLAELTAEARAEEIARMLSGEVTESTLAHAQELLARKAD